jgi:hypothetical protein
LLDFDIDLKEVENAIMNLSTENYYRGIDPSGKADFNVLRFFDFYWRSKYSDLFKVWFGN